MSGMIIYVFCSTRGRYGVVCKVVEIATGRVFAANFMSMRNKAQKNFFMSEYEVLRSLMRTEGALRIHDAFETERSLVFITELYPLETF